MKNKPTLLFPGLLDQDLQANKRTDVKQNILVGICPLVKFQAQRKYVPTASGNRDFISSPAHLHIRP